MNSWSFSSFDSIRLLVGGQKSRFSAEAFESLLLNTHVQAGWEESRHSFGSTLLMFLIYSS